ncbi:MAG TPA: hypothetical protein VFZ14_02035, partial [Burkholderiales bacterium]|nr:hypothetical protein [Burkholderiales bacterium]
MHHRPIALCAAAAMLSSVVMAQPSHGDTAVMAAADSVEAIPAQLPASVNPQDFSCKDLKDKLASGGSLTILAGPRGYGDTFYGPR